MVKIVKAFRVNETITIVADDGRWSTFELWARDLAKVKTEHARFAALLTYNDKRHISETLELVGLTFIKVEMT